MSLCPFTHGQCVCEPRNGTECEVFTELRAENARLREALRFYANPETWEEHTQGSPETGYWRECPLAEDGGRIARDALRGDKG